MREKLQTCLFSTAIGTAVAIGGVHCVVTAFNLPFPDMARLFALCLLFSLVASVLLCLRFGGWVLLAGSVVLVSVFFKEDILPSLQTLLYRLTKVYNMAYGTGITAEVDHSLTPAMCLLAGMVAVVFAWTICRRQAAYLATIYGVLPLAACMVVLDTVPDELGVFLVLAGLVLLLLTNTVRRRSAADGNRLTAILLIPVLLLTTVLFWAVPREGYMVQNGHLQQVLSDWFWQLPFAPELPGVDGNGSGGAGTGVAEGLEVDLSAVGPNNQGAYAVMDVTASTEGMLYLRGQAYDIYTGTRWQVSENLEGDTLGWPAVRPIPVGQVRIRTRTTRSLRFFPYYVAGRQWLEDYTQGAVNNLDRLREYIFNQVAYGSGKPLHNDDKLDRQLRQHYLQLPEDTKIAAEKLLRNAGIEGTEEIAAYVSRLATYDLLTEAMPRGEKDFALWFLEEGDTGYCVHFATATTVLLRAAGIPARYVTGYLTWTKADTTIQVTANQAHAWVEYYDADEGWKVLEPTPSEGLAQPPAEQPTETTEPEQTTEPEETTAPEGTTEPGERPTSPQDTEPDGTTGTPGGTEKPKTEQTWLLWALKIVGWIGAALAALWLQLVLRRRWRYRRMHAGIANAQAIARWREVRRMCRILKEETPERLEELAEKAKFSQHRIEREELREFDHWLTEARKRFRDQPCRLLRTLFWAV